MIENLLIFLFAFIITYLISNTYFKRRFKKVKMSCDKNLEYFELMNQWMNLKEKGINLDVFFLKKNYTQIAIYGYGKLGKHLYTELENTKVRVKCFVDKNPPKGELHTPVIGLDEEIPSVDVIVVTTFMEYETIKSNIEKKSNTNIIPIDEVVYCTVLDSQKG